MFFSVYTLGCKLNQLETEAITDSFCREGFTLIPWDSSEHGSDELGSEEPTIMVINTCTVTSMAEQKARRIIRKALKEHPRACLIITGCYAQMERAVLSALTSESGEPSESGEAAETARRLFVIPGEKKDRIMDLPRFIARAGAVSAGAVSAGTIPGVPELVASWLAAIGNDTAAEQEDGSFRFRPENFFSHSRGFLKIQDGCDRRCAYCRVSLARGKSRSLAAGEVLKRLESLERRGFAEAVLTGVNITQYRSIDMDMDMGLPELLDFLLGGTEKIRIRLSSVEPEALTDGYIGVLANPRIRPHFHLSMQSGSDVILQKMRRPYSAADVEKAAALLRSVRGDPFLACDIIAGFPGETEGEFEKTLELCGKIGFAWIHAFPFSPRPGTAAYDFPEKVNPRDAVRRVELLTDLARKGRRAYSGRWAGSEVEAVVEKGEGGREVPAVSENYLKLLVACGGEPVPAPGSLIRCRIRGDMADDGDGILRADKCSV